MWCLEIRLRLWEDLGPLFFSARAGYGVAVALFVKGVQFNRGAGPFFFTSRVHA
jgi:hypothetical protein